MTLKKCKECGATIPDKAKACPKCGCQVETPKRFGKLWIALGVLVTKTKAIRLSESEDRLIEEFLRKNPFFDFSSLARTAILKFMGMTS